MGEAQLCLGAQADEIGPERLLDRAPSPSLRTRCVVVREGQSRPDGVCDRKIDRVLGRAQLLSQRERALGELTLAELLVYPGQQCLGGCSLRALTKFGKHRVALQQRFASRDRLAF